MLGIKRKLQTLAVLVSGFSGFGLALLGFEAKRQNLYDTFFLSIFFLLMYSLKSIFIIFSVAGHLLMFREICTLMAYVHITLKVFHVYYFYNVLWTSFLNWNKFLYVLWLCPWEWLQVHYILLPALYRFILFVLYVCYIGVHPNVFCIMACFLSY